MSAAPSSQDAPVATKITQEVKQEVHDLQSGEIDTVETNARYLAYLARYKSLFVASSRYLAYSSDVGEAFRPVTAPLFVNAMYGGKFSLSTSASLFTFRHFVLLLLATVVDRVIPSSWSLSDKITFTNWPFFLFLIDNSLVRIRWI